MKTVFILFILFGLTASIEAVTEKEKSNVAKEQPIKMVKNEVISIKMSKVDLNWDDRERVNL